MQTEGEMQTENYRPGVKFKLGSKRNRFPGKTSRVSWDHYELNYNEIIWEVTHLKIKALPPTALV